MSGICICRFKCRFVFGLVSHNPHIQLLCDRENMKICLLDNLSFLDSRHFKSHEIWVLEKDQRQM